MSDSQSTKSKKKPRKQKDMRRVRTISPMAIIMPFINVNRVGSMNLMKDRIPVTKIDKFLKECRNDGMPNITMMHLLIAAYIRLVSQHPAINRFIRGQRVWTRKSVEIALAMKREMTLASPDTVIKVVFQPDATLREVYDKLDSAIADYRNSPGGDFDNTARALSHIPAVFLKFVIWFLKLLDYFGGLSKFLTRVSPFHCSMFITSMGSLGIPPIYHHLYDFGTCPLFIAFGAKQREYKVNPDGSVYKEQYIDIGFSCDERICDGFYYASSLKLLKTILKTPASLLDPPECVVEDID